MNSNKVIIVLIDINIFILFFILYCIFDINLFILNIVNKFYLS